MAKKEYLIEGVKVDEANNQITLELVDPEQPVLPDYVRPDLWYPRRNAGLTITLALSTVLAAPIDKQVPVGIYLDPNTNKYYRIRYRNGQWQEPVEVDHNGNPVGTR